MLATWGPVRESGWVQGARRAFRAVDAVGRPADARCTAVSGRGQRLRSGLLSLVRTGRKTPAGVCGPEAVQARTRPCSISGNFASFCASTVDGIRASADLREFWAEFARAPFPPAEPGDQSWARTDVREFRSQIVSIPFDGLRPKAVSRSHEPDIGLINIRACALRSSRPRAQS